MSSTAPLIVTLTLDDGSFDFFNGLRKTYFPAAINYIDAHLTLFHHLPPNEPSIYTQLENWSLENKPMHIEVTEVKSIGKGVAFKMECPLLLQLHQKMQKGWQQWLTPQDRQKIWPHVTVQNKVSPAVVKETLQSLQASFQPFTATGTGFSLWAYESGPWRFLQAFPFRQ